MDQDTVPHVTLHGGPLDGESLGPMLIDSDPGAYMVVPGEERRAAYEPLPGSDRRQWHFQGWTA